MGKMAAKKETYHLMSNEQSTVPELIVVLAVSFNSQRILW